MRRSSPFRRFRASGCIVVSLAIVLGACGDNQDDAGARDLLRLVREQNYASWERAPGWETRRPTSAPHADEVDLYVNTILSEAYGGDAALRAWPVGSIIVKDGWSGSDRELIAVMQKRDDGWYWAEFDDEDDPIYSGHPDLCIDCHRRGSDFVRAFGFP